MWQRWDWMQPIENMAVRPTFTMSQPIAMASNAFSGKPSFPEPTNTTP